MQYKLLAGAALAATAFAQNDETGSQSSQAAELLSVVSVLQTALPSSLVQEALSNSAAVSAEIASEFAAGETPDWFTALPSDVQTYLIPAGVLPTANATAITTGTGVAPFPTSNSTAVGGNNTTSSRTRTGTSTATLMSSESSQSGASATGDLSSSSSSSEAGASMPTAIMGMGLAGAVGLVGVLAL